MTGKIVAATFLATFMAANGAVVSVVAPQEGAAKSVTVGNKPFLEYRTGVSAPIRATANAGWVFAGWYLTYDANTGVFSDKAPLANAVDWRSPAASYIVGDEDVTLYARFITPDEEGEVLEFDLAADFRLLAGDVDDDDRPFLTMTNVIDSVLSIESLSLPTLTVSGLPPGLTFDKNSLRLKGTPTTPGVYKVQTSAKNASGYSFSQIFYVRVANVATAHVEGTDYLVYYGEEMDEDIQQLFSIDDQASSVRTVGIKGLPSGLRVAEISEDGEKSLHITGAPLVTGCFTVWCNVTFTDGTVESASAVLTVADQDLSDYYVELSALEGVSVGDEFLLEDEIVIGTYDNESRTGMTGIMGLPSGLTSVKVATDEGFAYLLKGTLTKAGEFSVKVAVACEEWDDDKEIDVIKAKTLAKTVIVGDRPGLYVAVVPYVQDESDSLVGCKVSGAGVYTPGTTLRLSATAGAAYSFAGWCETDGNPRLIEGNDYRTPAVSMTVREGMETEWAAAFVLKSEDALDISALNDYECTLDPQAEEAFEDTFAVLSGSLPSFTFKNLPAGMTFTPSLTAPGDYVLAYDPSTVARQPSPGRYRVTVSATNVSRNSDTAQFLVTVQNLTNADIHVESDYGVLTPNVAMVPISLSNAVDFVRGDTLTVSGLPAGLKYNDKAAPYCLSGTPTKPGEYTLTFTAKIVVEAVTNATTHRVTYTYRNATATAFITVKPFPEIAVVLSDEAIHAGNKVTGGGSFKAGTKVALKATAAKDWTFAGWSGSAGVTGLASLNPSLSYVMGTDDLTEIEANFIHKRDDLLMVADPGVVTVVKNAAFSTNLIEALIETRSLPSVTVTGLPTGLKFDSKTFQISGTVGPTAKPGYVYVTVAAKNASGYTFTRILKFVVMDNAGGDIPSEPTLANEANIDFSDLDSLVTGEYYPQGTVMTPGFLVGAATNDAEVASVSITGLPAGLKTAVTLEEGAAAVELYGTPTKPGRYTLKVQVSYADRKRVTSEYAFIVEDGGSGWLDVESLDVSLGTVSGAGVYASGATVKLGAKPINGYVFAGWYEEGGLPFEVIAESDGVDCRTAAATFLFRKTMFNADVPALFGDFVSKVNDVISIEGLDEVWEIDPATDDELPFVVDSASLPKLTVSGLPKGVTLNAAAGKFVYSSSAQAQIVPGYYSVTVKAVNQSNVSATETLAVFVANKTSDAIGGLDPSADAYPLYAGVTLDPNKIMPEVESEDGWNLTASGLPAGLKLVQDKTTGAYSVTGVPTKAATNTVTFTATKGTEKQIATITVGVAALPAWANGTYDGAYFTFEAGETNAVGSMSLTVSTAGKVSGKILTGGQSYSFSAASLESYDVDAGAFTVQVAVPWTRTDLETFLLSVGHDENGVGFVYMEPIEDGAKFVEAVQNAWLRKDLSAPDFAAGAKQPVLTLDSGVICKFGAKGVVTLSGKIGAVPVSGKAQALSVSAVEGANARVVVYAANRQFEGGSFCEIVDVMLSDADGDGKIDSVLLPGSGD